MFSELDIYKNHDHFFVMGNSSLENQCNAPKNASGVYIIYELSHGNIELVYIGCSGKMETDGELQTRSTGGGGLYGRIVNGHQFGDKRKISWINKINAEKIDALDIYWYETFTDEIQHIPAHIEGVLLQMHFDVYGRLPKWNKLY